MGFNNLIWSMFQGYKEVKDKRNPYEELDKAWYLYEVKDLRNLVQSAKSDTQLNSVLDHLYKWDATRVDPYKDIETKVIHKMWPE
jgi:hypothetical protein